MQDTPAVNDSTNAQVVVIRHSGRALVRGKIRRIWRPRFLELDDNGLVRYYEDREHHAKFTLLVFHARIIDVTTLRDVHVGLPMGLFGFLFHGQRYIISNLSTTSSNECHPPEAHSQARDFLCAVSTLEEAQSWVVALQWAAAEQRRKVLQQDDDWQDDFFQVRDAFQVVSTTQQDTTTTTTTATLQPRIKVKKEKPSKTVVTKVKALQLVRVHSWHFELAYSIHMLLLRTNGVNGGLNVEERVILRTLKDLQQMLTQLETEVTQKTSRQVLQQVNLPEHLHLYSDYLQSIPHVDRVLRALAMDPHIVNSQSMRAFWSLSGGGDSSPTTQPSLLRVHDASTCTSQVQLSSPRNAKDFVQQWLQQTVGSSEQQSELEIYSWSIGLWLLQRPAILVGGMACLVLLLPPLFRLYQWCMLTANVRLDVLLLSWAAAVFFGREYERRSMGMSVAAMLSSRRSKPTPDLLEEEEDDTMSLVDVHSVTSEEEAEDDSSVLPEEQVQGGILSSPLPQYPNNNGVSCWSIPEHDIFHVRGATYLQDRVKIPSAPAPFECRGVDIFLTDNPERHISRHPAVLGGQLGEQDTFVVNFLLPFGNFVAYFGIPSLDKFPSKLANVWTKFLEGDQQYRDARLKLLPVVMDGPWIVRAAVGPGTSPALLGKVIPLQYYFRSPSDERKGVYEVDVIITASRIAKGILNVVKGHTKMLTMAFAFIIEAAEEEELPETVLCTFQMHSIHLEACPQLPECNLDEIETV